MCLVNIYSICIIQEHPRTAENVPIKCTFKKLVWLENIPGPLPDCMTRLYDIGPAQLEHVPLVALLLSWRRNPPYLCRVTSAVDHQSASVAQAPLSSKHYLIHHHKICTSVSDLIVVRVLVYWMGQDTRTMNNKCSINFLNEQPYNEQSISLNIYHNVITIDIYCWAICC